MLAARRNDRVKGRTITLVVSMRTRNGLSQSGAPSGRKWAVDFFGFLANLDKMSLNQMGRPRVKVKIRCLEVLKVYGINPIRFTTTKRIKIADSTEVSPFR